MCATCGCGQSAIHENPHEASLYHENGHPPGLVSPDPPHGSALTHLHDGAAAHARKAASDLLDMEKAAVAENDHIASYNRSLFNRKHVRAVSLISSPGAGKTTLLEKTLTALRGQKVGCVVIEGDQSKDLDAQRIARTAVSVCQIETGCACHLEAGQIQTALTQIEMPERGFLFIENVGSLICPTAVKLGEHDRVTVLSTPEGHDKPEKYPLAFRNAAAVVISKTDLLPYVDFDLVEARRVIARLNPKTPIFEVSSTTGDGLGEWVSWLLHRRHGKA